MNDPRTRDEHPSPGISIAIPLLNEAEGVGELLRRTTAVLDALPGGPHEIVLVDDGSEDGTRDLLRAAALDDPRIRAIFLARNFGHQAALTAGLDHASGDLVVLMDGDLQDAPEEIPRFVEAWRAGADIVYARRLRRKEGVLLRAAYFLFYRLVDRLSSVRLPVDSGDFSLLSRPVVDELRRLPERHRYLRGLRSWIGFRQVGIDVERRGRFAGASRYSLARLFRLAFDGIFSFSVLPLRAVAAAGCAAIVASVAYAAWALSVRLRDGATPQGFTTLILFVIFFGGAQLFSLGILGEYIGRIYEESKRRPHYVVEEILGSPARPASHRSADR